ncbi:MAG: NAD-dependent epimerase/dehydratase family protein [Methanobacteriaceae archaeon]
MKKAVVTGATSMIGVALVDFLIKKGVKVLAISRPNSDKINNIPKSDLVEIWECDLSDLKYYNLDLNKFNNFKSVNDFDTFFHFGWVGTSKNARDNPNVQCSNINYTLDAVKLAKDMGCSTFIGAGSQAEYGITSDNLSENTLINPRSSYGIAKYSAGKLSKILCDDLGIKHVWGRILSVYGPCDNDYTLIMLLIHYLINNEKSTHNNNEDNGKFSTTNADQIWDYLYVDDCARAFFLMGENPIHGSVYPVGSGIPVCLRDSINSIKDIINPSCEIGFGDLEYSQNQVMNLCADIFKLTQDTGFKPEISFEEGIKRTLKWIKENK